MITMQEIYTDEGPSEVFIFYIFLLIDKNGNIKVKNTNDLKNVFKNEYKRLKKSHSHLEKKFFKEEFLRDLLISYLYLKKYFK